MSFFSITVEAKSLGDLRQQIDDLRNALDNLNEENMARIGKKLRLTYEDMFTLLEDYSEATGQSFVPLLQKHANEVDLRDVPIDLWWAIAREAHAAIDDAHSDEFDKYLAELRW